MKIPAKDLKNKNPGLRYERRIVLEPLEPEEVSFESCMALAGAIVKQALKDYCFAYEKLKSLRYRHHKERERKKALETMAEAEDFLLNTERIGLDAKTAAKVAAAFKGYKASLH